MIYLIKDSKGNYVDNHSICINKLQNSYIGYTGIASGIKYYKDELLANITKKELEDKSLKLGMDISFEVKGFKTICDTPIGKVVHSLLKQK